MPEPSKIPEAWAIAGDYNAIPTADPGNGLASWDYGFPVETQTPLAAGGIPPRRQDINGALYWLSTAQLWYQQGGLWQYDATENYEIGNVVEQNNAMYYCKAANGPSGTVKSPSADTAGAYWKKLVNADGTLNVAEVPNATTTVRGKVELATSAETKALTDATRAVTPSSLNGLLTLSPAALTVPKADSSGKLTGWLDAFKDNDGRVNISISGTAPQLQTARTVRVNLASTSTASFNGTTNITPGVTGVLPISNGGTGSGTKNFVDLTSFQVISANKKIRADGKGWEIQRSDSTFGLEFRTAQNEASGGVCVMGTGEPVFWRLNDQNIFYGRSFSSSKLENSRSFIVNLGSNTSASFDGTSNASVGVTGTLAVANGGTGQTNLDAVTVGKAKALNTARTVQTNLASTTAANFDGSANITPGVTGTLPVTNGGTGQTNLDAVTVGKAKALNTARTIQTNLASTSAANFNGTANVTPGVMGVLPVSNGGTGQTNLDAVTVGTAKHLTNSGIVEVLQSAYPIGSIYISYNATNPATLFGFGTWQKIEGRFLLGSSSAYALNSTGGSATVTLTTQQIPSHTHTASTASAGGHTHTVTINSAGSHSHSRGTMNITGTFSGVGQKYDGDPATLTGAFYVVNTEDAPPQGIRIRNDQGARDDYFGFDASRSWTGATTSEGYHTHGASTATAGAHTHTITVGNTGNGNAHDNMPPYIAVTIWRRTA